MKNYSKPALLDNSIFSEANYTSEDSFNFTPRGKVWPLGWSYPSGPGWKPSVRTFVLLKNRRMVFIPVGEWKG
jgi:hypothetical protein